MKKHVLSVMLTFFVLLTVIPAAVNVMASGTCLSLGDSITTGFGLNSNDKSFAEQLSENNGYFLVNKAVNGNTAYGLYEQLITGADDSYIRSSNVITITCGGNDLVNILCGLIGKKNTPEITSDEVKTILNDEKNIQRLSIVLTALSVINGDESAGIPALADCAELEKGIDEYINNLNNVIAYIRNLNSETKIIVATQYNPYKSFSSSAYADLCNNIDSGIKKLNDAIKENSLATREYLVADVYSAFDNDERNLCNADPDTPNFDFHPNKEGHDVIYRCFSETITAQCLNYGENGDFYQVFSDVSNDDWFYQDVEYVSKKGLFNGTGNSRFSPMLQLNRAMILTVLYRGNGTAGYKSDCPFSDVSKDEYYYDAVAWGYNNGIITGYSDFKFAPDDYITREQLAVIMYRYAEYKNLIPDGMWAVVFDYKDADDISSYAGKAVMYCKYMNLMTGYENKMFAPGNFVTRAEAAAVLKRFFEIYDL